MSSEAETVLHRDRSLWDRWRGGDRDAGSQLLELYEGAMYGALRRFGVRERSEIEDLYGDLVLALAEYKERCELQTSFFGLARRMILSLILRHRDRRDRARRVADVDDSDVADEKEGGEGRPSILESIQHCLRKHLKPQEQDLFRDRFLGGLDNRTLAGRHGKTTNHIAVIVHGAVQKMRRCLAGEGFAP